MMMMIMMVLAWIWWWYAMVQIRRKRRRMMVKVLWDLPWRSFATLFTKPAVAALWKHLYIANAELGSMIWLRRAKLKPQGTFSKNSKSSPKMPFVIKIYRITLAYRTISYYVHTQMHTHSLRESHRGRQSHRVAQALVNRHTGTHGHWRTWTLAQMDTGAHGHWRRHRGKVCRITDGGIAGRRASGMCRNIFIVLQVRGDSQG